MPLTPEDTRTTAADEIQEQLEDTVDTVADYGRDRPFTTVAVAFALGLLTARALF